MIEKLKEVLNTAQGEIIICGHKNIDADSLLSMLLLQDLFSFLGYKCRAIIPDSVTDEQPLMTASALDIDLNKLKGDINENDFVFLVDCHGSEYSKNILGCIDHHPTSEEICFPFCINKRATSAAMIVIRLMESIGMVCERKHYIYAVFSAYLDTLALKSVKTDKNDIPWLEDKIEKYDIDRDILMSLGLGINDQKRSVDQLARIGYKEYIIYGTRISTSFIMYETIEDKLKDAIVDHIKKVVDTTEINLWIYFFCDPQKEYSEVVEIAKQEITIKRYDRIISRGIDIVPELEMRFGNKE